MYFKGVFVMSEKGLFLLLPLIFIIVGVFLVFIGIRNKNSFIKKQERCTKHIYGVVKDMIYCDMTIGNPAVSGYSCTYYPVYSCIVDGVSVDLKAKFGLRKDYFYKGQRVNIYINPKNYSDFYVKEDNWTYKIYKILWGIGFPFVFLGFASMLLFIVLI